MEGGSFQMMLFAAYSFQICAIRQQFAWNFIFAVAVQSRGFYARCHRPLGFRRSHCPLIPKTLRATHFLRQLLAPNRAALWCGLTLHIRLPSRQEKAAR